MLLRNPRILLICFGAAIAVLAALSLRYFSQAQPLQDLTVLGQQSQSGQIALEADDVQVVGRNSGHIRWRMAARSVTLSRDRRILTVSMIHRGTLYDSDTRPAVALTADRASYETPFGALGLGSAGYLRVNGNVTAHVLSAAHPVLQAQLIIWNSENNELSSPSAVTATLPKLSVTAGNASYLSPPGTPANGVMHLGGVVHARFDSVRGTATIDCPGLTWTAAQQTAQTVGPVTARIPGGLGTATASDIQVSTHTGDLTGHGFRGTLLLSHGVQ